MAIAFDTQTHAAELTTNSFSWSHTCTGSNLILWVTFRVRSATDIVTGVTYNGVAMTKDKGIYNGDAGHTCFVYHYFLIAPATGSNTVVISLSSSQAILGWSTSYTGAKQTGQPDSSNTNNSGTGVASISTSTTVVAANSWLITTQGNSLENPTSASGFTQRGSSDSGVSMGDSNGVVSTGSNTCTWNFANTDATPAMIVSSFAPAPSNTGAAFLLKFI